MSNESAAEQFREYAGIEAEDLDVENKSKKGGPIETPYEEKPLDVENEEPAAKKSAKK